MLLSIIACLSSKKHSLYFKYGHCYSWLFFAFLHFGVLMWSCWPARGTRIVATLILVTWFQLMFRYPLYSVKNVSEYSIWCFILWAPVTRSGSVIGSCPFKRDCDIKNLNSSCLALFQVWWCQGWVPGSLRVLSWWKPPCHRLLWWRLNSVGRPHEVSAQRESSRPRNYLLWLCPTAPFWLVSPSSSALDPCV